MPENDILTHELVPEHRILDKNEIKQITEELSVTVQQLPKILDTDPVVEAIGAKVGDVLEITRNSQTAGKTKYYRTVIPE